MRHKPLFAGGLFEGVGVTGAISVKGVHYLVRFG